MVEAAPEPTYEEKMRVPRPHPLGQVHVHTGLYKRKEKWRIVNKSNRYGTVFTFVVLLFRDLQYGHLSYRTL